MNSRLYLIIGGDGQEYGPVSEVEVRDWILQGRANERTAVQIEGSPSWIVLKALPEFAESLDTQARALASRPPEIPLDATAAEAEFKARAAALDLGSCFDRSWNLFKLHPLLLVSSSSLICLISIGLEFIPSIGPAVSTVFGMALWVGVSWIILKLVRGETASFGDCLVGFKIGFLQLCLGGIVASVLIMVGLILCVLPGIYLTVAWLCFAPLLIVDKKYDFWPAFELSRRVVTANWWNIFALFLASFVILVGGLLVVGIGVFFALPVATGAIVYAYEDIFGSSRQKTFR